VVNEGLTRWRTGPTMEPRSRAMASPNYLHQLDESGKARRPGGVERRMTRVRR